MNKLNKLIIGVCAMDTKARSKPMRNILDRLNALGEFETVIFGDKVILDEPIENWPKCDILISFFSLGFPLTKAIEYVDLMKPFCVNDLLLQTLLFDRRSVLLLLDSIDVPTGQRLVANRDKGPQLPKKLEDLVSRDFNIDFTKNLFPKEEIKMLDQETLQIGTKTIKKPFVEKPVDSEDHNIYIYYSKEQGGGVRKLFRKVENQSSSFDPSLWHVRTVGSFIYEEFLTMERLEDVKIYTVGPYFSYAETRKSPVVDGVVQRDSEGKEVRSLTKLSDEEQEISRRICMAFGQTICGFDLLRANDKSFIIDVNGWSFVKGNDFYYETCANYFRDLFLRAVRRRKLSLYVEPVNEHQWKLKAFLAVLRHADRTPKQKIKYTLKNNLHLVTKYLTSKNERIIKKSETIAKFSQDLEQLKTTDDEKLTHLKLVLNERIKHGDTKLQLKTTKNKNEILVIVKWGGEFTHAGRHHSKDLGENLRKEIALVNKKIIDDVRIYSSSERRAIATAQVFSKAFLPSAELPVDLIKISKEMLDDSFAVKDQAEEAKRKLMSALNGDAKEFAKERADLETLCLILKEMKLQLESRYAELSRVQEKWCTSENPILFKERWDKIIQEFLKQDFDISKISELYDSLKFDLLHSLKFFKDLFFFFDGKDEKNLRNFISLTHSLYKFVSQREYGFSDQDKLVYGSLASTPLISKLISDMNKAQEEKDPVARFYFTKESHMYTLLNVILLSGLAIKETAQVKGHELDYLSYISFEIYQRENSNKSEYSMRIGSSQGAHGVNLLDTKLDSRHSISVQPRKWISDYMELDQAKQILSRTLVEK